MCYISSTLVHTNAPYNTIVTTSHHPIAMKTDEKPVKQITISFVEKGLPQGRPPKPTPTKKRGRPLRHSRIYLEEKRDRVSKTKTLLIRENVRHSPLWSATFFFKNRKTEDWVEGMSSLCKVDGIESFVVRITFNMQYKHLS